MQRSFRNFLSNGLRFLFRSGLRLVITVLIFSTCLVVASHYLGLPVPSPAELLDKIKGISQLSEVLS